jgi:predicted phage terminase large subunit-like protein
METAVEEKAQTKQDVLVQAVQDPLSTMRSLTKGRFFLFFQYFWSTYSDDKLIVNWHIEYLCDELEKIGRNVAAGKKREYDLIINVPPGTSKTAIVSIFFPIWCWVNWYNLRFITASYTSALSLESAEYSREVVRSEKFSQMFPEIGIKDDKDTKSNFRVVKREFVHKGRVPRIHTGGNRFSTSVGGAVTGFHAHILIWDDPLDPNRAARPTEVKKANTWMDRTLPFRKSDKEVSVTIGVMQRLDKDDPTGHLLKTRDDIKHICLPGEINTPKYRQKVSPPHLVAKYKNGLLDPIRLTEAALKTFLNLGQFTYGSQIGQDPVPLGGGMFKVGSISVMDRMPTEEIIVKQVRYWDKAGTEGGNGAYTVGVKMAELTNGTWCVLDVKRGRWGTAERERIIKATAQADAMVIHQRCIPRIYVEQEPGSGGKESAESTIKNLAGHAVYKDRPTGDKTYRADPYSVQVNEGNVSMVKADWNEEYVDELETFPNSTYKDQTDASSGAFSKLSGLKSVKVR